MGLKWERKGCDLMADRFDIEQVIRILGLEIRADQADDGRDFDVACRIALEKLMKCKEYEHLEEQGLLLRLPCKVGDTVYCIYERYTKCSENGQEFDEYSCQGCECLECDSHKELYVQSQKAYSLDWIVLNLERFGKTVLLTQEEAEQKLKEMSK